MQFALNRKGEKIEARRGVKAVCPLCGKPVIAKCGRIVIHHWAHEVDADCDVWFEAETEWHRAWKAQFPAEWTEVPFGEHRADVFIPDRGVIELQHSAISPDDIEARESFYGSKMVWLIDGSELSNRLFIMERYRQTRLFKFKWKLCPRSWTLAKRPRFIDLGSTPSEALLGESIVSATVFPDLRPRKGVKRELTRIQSLPDDLRTCSILRIHTLYENGWGSVELYTRDEFMLLLLGRASRANAVPSES